MDGIVTQVFRNLGKIHLTAADELLGGVDFHQGKVINNTIARIITENLL